MKRREEGDDQAGDRQTWVMWNVSRKLLIVVGTLIMAGLLFLVNVGLNYWWFGHP